LKRLQRGLARKKKGSNNRKKWKLKIARVHERVSNLRNDFLHKFTSLVAKSFSIVCVEDLCLKGWIGRAGKSTYIEMEGVSLLAGSGYIGVTPVEFAASALKLDSM
jgi:transposase